LAHSTAKNGLVSEAKSNNVVASTWRRLEMLPAAPV
jgi:hypothetical protein